MKTRPKSWRVIQFRLLTCGSSNCAVFWWNDFSLDDGLISIPAHSVCTIDEFGVLVDTGNEFEMSLRAVVGTDEFVWVHRFASSSEQSGFYSTKKCALIKDTEKGVRKATIRYWSSDLSICSKFRTSGIIMIGDWSQLIMLSESKLRI